MELVFHYNDARGRLKTKRLALPTDRGVLTDASGYLEIAIIDDGEVATSGRDYDLATYNGPGEAVDDLEQRCQRREFDQRFAEFQETNPSPVALAAFGARIAKQLGIDLDELDDPEADTKIAAE